VPKSRAEEPCRRGLPEPLPKGLRRTANFADSMAHSFHVWNAEFRHLFNILVSSAT
jgi:hypothetical protein